MGDARRCALKRVRHRVQGTHVAAAARAAHVEVDQLPFIFEDVLARRLHCNQAEELLSYHPKGVEHLTS